MCPLMPVPETAVATNLVSSAIMAGLLRRLVQKGVLEAADVREIYEMALMLLEQQQATVPKQEATFIAARAVLEVTAVPTPPSSQRTEGPV